VPGLAKETFRLPRDERGELSSRHSSTASHIDNSLIGAPADTRVKRRLARRGGSCAAGHRAKLLTWVSALKVELRVGRRGVLFANHRQLP
jgi:hypothetical protein